MTKIYAKPVYARVGGQPITSLEVLRDALALNPKAVTLVTGKEILDNLKNPERVQGFPISGFPVGTVFRYVASPEQAPPHRWKITEHDWNAQVEVMGEDEFTVTEL